MDVIPPDVTLNEVQHYNNLSRIILLIFYVLNCSNEKRMNKVWVQMTTNWPCFRTVFNLFQIPKLWQHFNFVTLNPYFFLNDYQKLYDIRRRFFLVYFDIECYAWRNSWSSLIWSQQVFKDRFIVSDLDFLQKATENV